MEEEQEEYENEELVELRQEVQNWKTKYKQLELKKRESDISLNKIKTEINSLRSVDKLWKDSAKAVYLNLNDVKNLFDSQIDQIVDGLSGLTKAGERVTSKIPYNKKVKSVIAQLQVRIAKQEDSIMTLNSKIRMLTTELAEKTSKVERLSQGIEEEVDRLMKPIREKLAESMVLIMKEKAARAQERREIADLWPAHTLMPSILMRYRAISTEERERRVKLTREQEASFALAHEIRANVFESKMWEIKYDDYGRAFYEHQKTGETNWEVPAILSYKPPPGRDEMGNIIGTEETDLASYHLRTDHRGEVFYEHKKTGEITHIPPSAYKEIPRGKSREIIVSEAAQTVLGYIREKVLKHIEETKKLQYELENPLTPEEAKKKEKEEKNKSTEERAADAEAVAEKEAEDAAEPLDLSVYQYDIETVEMLAALTEQGGKSSADADPDEVRAEKRAFLAENAVRKFDPDSVVGKTLAEVDLETVTLPQLRAIVEELAVTEEKLEQRVDRVRENIKDFSFILMERMAEQEKAQARALQEELKERERERRAQAKQFMLDRQREAAEKMEQQRKALEEQQKLFAEQLAENPDQEVVEGEGSGGGAEEQPRVEEEGSQELGTASQVEIEEGSLVTRESTAVLEKEGEEKPQETSGALPGEDSQVLVEDSLVTRESGSEARRRRRRRKRRATQGERTVISIEDAGDDLSHDGFSDSEGDEDDELLDEDESSEVDNFNENAKELTNYGAILFADPQFDASEPDFPEEIVKLSSNLVNFALFCGYTNLHVSEAPHDSSLDYSLRLDDCRGEHLQNGEGRDDEWLSSSFFLSCTQEKLDAIRAATVASYEATSGVLPIGPLDSQVLVMRTEKDDTVERPLDKSYTYSTAETNAQEQAKYRLWRTRQLMADVLRVQIQQEAVQQAYAHRFEAFRAESVFSNSVHDESTVTNLMPVRTSRLHPHGIPMLTLRVKTAFIDPEQKFPSVLPNLYYVMVHIGGCLCRTSAVNPTPQGLRWDRQSVSGKVPINDVQLDECIVEILDENPETPQQAFIGRGHVTIDHTLGHNMGRDVTCRVNILTRAKDYYGTLEMTISVDVDEYCSNHVADPKNLNFFEINRKASKTKKIEMGLDASPSLTSVAVDAPHSLNSEAFASLSTLVGDLRGDGVGFIRLLTGDVSIQDLQRVGAAVDSKYAQNLPNFRHASIFLEKKTNRHKWELDKMYVDIESFYTQLEDILGRKFETTNKIVIEKRGKLKKVNEQSEDIKKEVLKIQKSVLDSRKPHAEPKEPVFPELPAVPWVPKLPVSGGLDSRGKKKKALPNADLKQLIDAAESGALDGADNWPIPENLFPSQAQLLKLGKAMAVRNAVLDQKRKGEEELRERLQEAYLTEVERWEVMERRRMKELERNKKDCRKINLKFDSFMEIVARAQREYDQVEVDLGIITDLKALHAKCKQRFKLARFKQQLEYERQKQYLDSLKKRLLRALKARRHALSLPETASDDLQYTALCRQSEAALRTLRYEIFECKQILLAEGLRLRTLFTEEHRLCLNELSRAKLSREIIIQRDCYDRILERYKFEVVNLYSEMEKLRLREAESDETGVDTVNDLGERYNPEKKWTSPDVLRCQKLIDICMAKINLTEGLGNSTAHSQKLVMDVMTTKWGADFLPMRDSWTDHADFDRAQHLLEDTLQWAQVERAKLERARKETERDKLDLQMQLGALNAHQEVAVVTHETETKTITSCSTDVINVMRDHLDQYREESQTKIQELDKSIISLSRECQKVREELLAQEMVFDEKLKVLWAFIHTLQTAVQQLSARMEMVLEEKEKIVIESKLVADKMRHHLRIERRHCANLLFIIQSQRGTAKFLTDVIAKLTAESKIYVTQQILEKSNLRKEIWEQVFAFTRLSTDVDALFEFFAARLANLAGARASLNNALAGNGAAQVLAALCRSPRPVIRKFAARALGGMGWDGFVETRILLWDSVMFWKMFKAEVIAKENEEFKSGLDRFNQTGKMEAIINMNGEVEEFVPSGNMSLRTIIKQRRQWALRAARRREGPNIANQRQLNVRDGVLPALLDMTLKDGAVDWEICRNSALAISISSYEPQNHKEIMDSQLCIDMIVDMCKGVDAEVQTHAAVTIANLSHKDESAQRLFGNSGAIEALVRLCASTVVDVLEAATSALANLTSYSDHNCVKVLECDGTEVLVRVVTQSYSENLLDLDQNDEVQANAAETLANISRFSVDATAPYFAGKIIDALVVMCASQNRQLRRHIPLVMGNIGQIESCRAEIGVKGGIEALFLVLEDTDTTTQANTLWSLCNLMWHPPNQERAGRFMADILQYLESPWAPVRTQAITLLANTLYYNNSNRVRFLESEGAMELILSFASNRAEVPLVEGALRSLLSLSYVDAIAMWLGPTGGFIPMFLDFLSLPYYSRDSMRYSLEILCNLCLHHANRRIIYDNGGVDAIVGLHIDTDPHIRELSVQIIDYLEDITPAEVLARSKEEVGLERMVTLAASSDPLVRAVAAESIGEEIWLNPSKQARANEIGGVDVLLGIASNTEEPVESLLPALWSLRNIIHDQPQAKLQFGYRDGISIMNSVVRRGFTGAYAAQSEKIFEAALSCLSTAALHDERNSRRLLNVALPAVLDLADGRVSHASVVIDGSSAASTVSEGMAASSKLKSQVLSGMRGEGVNALAKALLLQLAPYNYVVCKNCHKRQDLHGTTCYNCGHRLLVEPDITEIELRKTFERQSSTLSRSLANSPAKSKAGMGASFSLSAGGSAKAPAGVSGLRRMAEERRDTSSSMSAAALNTAVHVGSSSKRLYSPQPLGSPQKQYRQQSNRSGADGIWESKNTEGERMGHREDAGSGQAPLLSQTVPLSRRPDSTSSSVAVSGVNGGELGQRAAPVGGGRSRPSTLAGKMALSKSAAALDRALVVGSELLASTSAKHTHNAGDAPSPEPGGRHDEQNVDNSRNK